MKILKLFTCLVIGITANSLSLHSQYEVGQFVSDTIAEGTYTSVEYCYPYYDVAIFVDPVEYFTEELPTGLQLKLVILDLIPQEGAPTADIGLQDETILEIGMEFPIVDASSYFELTFFSALTVEVAFVIEGTPEVVGETYHCMYTFNGSPEPCLNSWILKPLIDFDIELCEVLPPNSIKEMSLSPEVKVFPNPTSDILNVLVPVFNSESYDLRIVDVNGRIVLNEELFEYYSNSINLSSLEKGIYFVEIELENQTISKRIIVN